MNPHHYYPGWSYPAYRRGPRRIFWFLLGGLAATLWLKGKERERRPVEYSNESLRARWNLKKSESAETDAERERWQATRENIAAVGSNATDTVADMSEAALDTILHAVEALKLKLSDHRNIRQRPEEEPKNAAESHHHV